MKVLGKFFWFILLTVNLLALIAMLIASFSDIVSPYRWLIFSYFGLFFPFVLVGNLFILLIWLLFRRWKLVALNVIVLLVCGGAIHTYFPINWKTKNLPENSIKLLTYNVMRFERGKPDLPQKPNEILQYIKDSKADIVCIQEYGASSANNSSTLSEKTVSNALKDYPYRHIHYLDFPYANEIFGLAIFSKFPILEIKKVPYESDHNGSFVAVLDINGKKTTLINNHLESNKLSQEERDDYLSFTKEIDSESLNTFTKMMHKRLSPAFKIRALQAQTISKIIEENENPYIIVCGDFNDTPISYARHKIKGDLKDAFVESGTGLGITYNQYRFLFRIDYILHSKNIKSYNCTVGKLKNSDHYPVSCFLELKD